MKLYDDTWDKHRLGIFEPMPFQGNENMLVDASGRAINEDVEDDEETEEGATKASEDVPNFLNDNKSDDGDTNVAEIFQDMRNMADASQSSGSGLDFLNDIIGLGSGPTPQTASTSSPLDDIFGTGSSAPSSGFGTDIFGGSSSGGNGLGFDFGASLAPAAPKYMYKAYEDSNITIHFNFERDPMNKAMHKITAFFTNKSGSNLDSISMLFSVKKH